MLRVFVATMLISAAAGAQGLISAGIGVGGGVGERNKNNSGHDVHALGFVQLHPPLFPFAVRADALFSKVENNGTALSLIGDAVILAPIPIVQPYAVLGYGQYGIGKDGSRGGWNGGVGVRVKVPSLTVFGEARRHQRITHDLLTIGIAL